MILTRPWIRCTSRVMPTAAFCHTPRASSIWLTERQLNRALTRGRREVNGVQIRKRSAIATHAPKKMRTSARPLRLVHEWHVESIGE